LPIITSLFSPCPPKSGGLIQFVVVLFVGWEWNGRLEENKIDIFFFQQLYGGLTGDLRPDAEAFSNNQVDNMKVGV
jgi:hypothetical protein